MPFHAISSGIFRSLERRFSKFANCSGVFQSLQKLQWHFSKFGNCSGIFMNRHICCGIYLIFLETEAGCQLGCAGHSGMSRQPSLLCLPTTNPVVFFLSENGQPSFFVICQVSRFVRPIGLQIFQDEESFIRLDEKMAYQ